MLLPRGFLLGNFDPVHMYILDVICTGDRECALALDLFSCFCVCCCFSVVFVYVVFDVVFGGFL